MKKKLFALALALGLTLSLSACGGDSGKEPPAGGNSAAPENTTQAGGQTAGQESGAPTGGEAAGPFLFADAQGRQVAVNDNMADGLALLGEAQSYFEAESCAFEGLDKTYTYPGFVITTRPEGEADYVNSIRLTDDTVATPEGVFIGSTTADVTAAYGGSAGADDTLLNYTAGDVTLSFILENGAVVSIEYLPA